MLKQTKTTRNAIGKLAGKMGYEVSYFDFMEEVMISPKRYDLLLYENLPNMVKELMDISLKQKETISMLLSHLGLEVFEGKEIRSKAKK